MVLVKFGVLGLVVMVLILDKFLVSVVLKVGEKFLFLIRLKGVILKGVF